MKILGVIPARYASTRFPGKPLVMIRGKSMIRRVYEQAAACQALSQVMVATDDERIFNHVRDFGGLVAMTSASHRSGTDRLLEVIEKQLVSGSDPGWEGIVNIQGDEPYIDPRQIGQLVSCFSDPQVQIATLAKSIADPTELVSQDVVKVVFDNNYNALYFSRLPIPFLRNFQMEDRLDHHNYYKHIGLYAYRVNTLKKICRLPSSSLELAESLEQLRWLQNGYKIHVELTEYESISVDTPGDLKRLEQNENH